MLTKQLLVHKRTGEVPGLAVLVLAVVFPVEGLVVEVVGVGKFV